MIIEIDDIPFKVEYGYDDDCLYLTNAVLHGYDLIDFLSDEAMERIENKIIKRLAEEHEENKFENAIDDYGNRWIEL